jgi:hypothetical protein
MAKRDFARFLSVALGAAVLGFGCSRTPTPPSPLAVGEIPVALTKAYLSAKPEIKEVADKVVSAVQGTNYPEAYSEIQLLCSAAGETKDQRVLATRAMLTITSLLQDAQNQGDQQASAALRVYQMTK